MAEPIGPTPTPSWKQGPDVADIDKRNRQLYDAFSREHYVQIEIMDSGDRHITLTMRGRMHCVNLCVEKGLLHEELTIPQRVALVVYGDHNWVKG